MRDSVRDIYNAYKWFTLKDFGETVVAYGFNIIFNGADI